MGAAIGTRGSFGMSTAITDTKHGSSFHRAPPIARSIDKKRNLDFPKLVTGMMSNPFVSASLNSQAKLYSQGAAYRINATSVKCRPCRDQVARYRKTSNVGRYK